jgi:hypothetical protein
MVSSIFVFFSDNYAAEKLKGAMQIIIYNVIIVEFSFLYLTLCPRKAFFDMLILLRLALEKALAQLGKRWWLHKDEDGRKFAFFQL